MVRYESVITAVIGLTLAVIAVRAFKDEGLVLSSKHSSTSKAGPQRPRS
jgi:hypothetical protein